MPATWRGPSPGGAQQMRQCRVHAVRQAEHVELHHLLPLGQGRAATGPGSITPALLMSVSRRPSRPGRAAGASEPLHWQAAKVTGSGPAWPCR